MAGKTTAHEEDVLNVMRATTLTAFTGYIALFTANPTDAGGGTEVTGGGYARVAITFGAPAGTPRVMANTNAILITMPASTVTGAAIMDDPTAGEMKYWIAITPKDFDSGDSASLAVGAITVQED